MSEIERVAKGLTEAQRAALMHKHAGGSAYAWAQLKTIEALCSRGLVSRIGGVGAFYSPRTVIRWPLTPIGLQVRDYLKGQV